MARPSYLRRIAGLLRNETWAVRLSPPPLPFRPGLTAADFMVVDQHVHVAPRPFAPVVRDLAPTERTAPSMATRSGGPMPMSPTAAPAVVPKVPPAAPAAATPDIQAKRDDTPPREIVRTEHSTRITQVLRTVAASEGQSPRPADAAPSLLEAPARDALKAPTTEQRNVAQSQDTPPAAALGMPLADLPPRPTAVSVIPAAAQQRCAAPAAPRPVPLPALVPPRPAVAARTAERMASSVQIGVLEVKVAPAARATAAMPTPAAPARTTVLRAAAPVARLARGYAAFGLTQS